VACLAVGLASGVLLSRTRAASSADASSSAELTTVRFVIDAPSARQVSLVGDFNRWDASANPMRPSQDGQSWIIEVPLSRGRHTYAFVVDGDVLRDPSAPTLVDDDFGVRNSIIFVGDGRT
jgi:1,4-alpha-glucan branching enzyme